MLTKQSLLTSSRVAFLEDRLHGGIGRNIVNLSNTMTSFGIAADVLIKHVEGSYLNQLHAPVQVMPVRTFNRISGIPRIISYVRRYRPIALIASSERLASIALQARKFSGYAPNILACVHNIDGNWLRETVSSSYPQRLKRIRRYYPQCDQIIFVSDGLRQRFLKETGIPANNTCVIYNPIITDDLYRLAEEPLDHPWFAANASPVILASARLKAQKDYPTLIKAFARVRQKQPCRLFVLGDGELRSELEALSISLQVCQDIQFYGWADNPYPFMKHARLFVLSSIHEGLGNVLIEALALGLPIVSTDCPYGPSEILDDGRYGKLTPVGDVNALAAAMDELLHTSPVSPESRKSAVTRFRADTVTRQYLERCGGHHHEPQF